jgi:hypothetical protein
MADDELDAFGNPIGGSQAAPGSAPAPVPNLGRFAEPLSPPPSAEAPPASRIVTPDLPPPGEPMPAFPKTAPGATAALIIGLFGLFLLLPAPFAWWRGRAMVREIDASGGRLGGRSQARAAQVLGILGTILLVLTLIGEISVLSGPGH